MKRTAIIAALACSVVLTGPALAQSSSYDQNFANTDYEQTTSGTIDSIRIVDAPELREDLVVARVRPHNARTNEFAFVGLGSESELRSQGIRLSENQNITASGQMERIQGRPVLMAKQIVVDGERIALDRDMQFRDDSRRQQSERDYDRVWPYRESPDYEQSQDTARGVDRQGYQDRDFAAGDPHVVRGEVQSVRDFSIDGVKESHRLLRVTDTSRGMEDTVVVDLGPTSGRLAQLDFEAGDRVMVQGHPTRIDGRSAIRATQIAEVYMADDELVGEERLYSSRLRMDSPEPQDSMGQRVGKPQQHDLPSRTSGDVRNW